MRDGAEREIKMKKEIREIKDGVLCITTLNERWYAKPSINKETGLPEYRYFPSSTWIAGYYPKGIGFMKWLAEKGWDEAEAIKQAAGDKGSKSHYACQDIDAGQLIDIQTSKYVNPSTGQEEELTPEEIDCILSFRDWTDAVKPELLASELTAFNEAEGYAGTIDRIYRINGQILIPDLKTGQTIWPEWELQISSYSHLDIDYKALGITDEEWKNRKLAVLQIGYRKNQNRYKFTVIEDKFALFMHAKAIWANENPEAEPKEAKYPLVIQSKVRLVQSQIGSTEIKPEVKPEEQKVKAVKKSKK
jgi:hypothetical protein